MNQEIDSKIQYLTKNDFIYQDSGRFLEALLLAKKQNFVEAVKIFDLIANKQNVPYHIKNQAKALSILYR